MDVEQQKQATEATEAIEATTSNMDSIYDDEGAIEYDPVNNFSDFVLQQRQEKQKKADRPPWWPMPGDVVLDMHAAAANFVDVELETNCTDSVVVVPLLHAKEIRDFVKRFSRVPRSVEVFIGHDSISYTLDEVHVSISNDPAYVRAVCKRHYEREELQKKKWNYRIFEPENPPCFSRPEMYHTIAKMMRQRQICDRRHEKRAEKEVSKMISRQTTEINEMRRYLRRVKRYGRAKVNKIIAKKMEAIEVLSDEIYAEHDDAIDSDSDAFSDDDYDDTDSDDSDDSDDDVRIRPRSVFCNDPDDADKSGSGYCVPRSSFRSLDHRGL